MISLFSRCQHKHGKEVAPHYKVIWFFVVKMFAVLSALHFLTLCAPEISAQPDRTIDALVGQDVNFPVENQCEDQFVVTFQLLSPVDAVLASRGMNMSGTQHPLYKDRLYWSANGSPVLVNVQVNDSKRYATQIDCYHESSMTTAKQIYDLRVFEPVLKPVITPIWKCPSPNITLSCSVSNGANVTFYWNILSLSENTNRTFEGPELVVNHENEWKQYTFRCIVKNRVSNASSGLTITELCNEHNFASELCRYIFAGTLLLVFHLIILNYQKVKSVRKQNNREKRKPGEKEVSL
ncbi:SLAM family member 5-like isoform X2 [Mobula hypostoma]|uniref:SLAM family member 5-like isoform X2 n=1 Tax=Mobula hypostoma TaxID=723540 RepID=UPI002FC393E9